MTYVTSMKTRIFRALRKGARRRMSEDAAYRDAARALVLERRPCDCCRGTWVAGVIADDGQTCLFHDGRYEKLIARVARLMKRHDLRSELRRRIREQQAEVANVIATAEANGLGIDEVRP
jgi:hypothetical protein